ncbi:hypothetical protein M404DRAFT_998396 [Pisolithus tinctorius Marx 270]|uniref:Uncharacterized protein n=1 Tax=Pisolithus tinctorius Marx 270 TaxID=870435 RepID=A0A0C3P1N0_PISTI|nr:hypothetical protein M404DRAFT_998396 [Pisolithus tinctorius Marx 270]
MGEEEPEGTLRRSIPDMINLKSMVNMPYHFGSWWLLQCLQCLTNKTGNFVPCKVEQDATVWWH